MIIKKTIAVILVLSYFSIVSANSGKSMFSTELLKAAGLKNVWESRISLVGGETVDKIWESGKNIYILSNSNYLTCLDKENGEMKFGLEIASVGIPIFEPYFGDGLLCIIAGNEVINLDSELGTVLARYPLGYTAVTRLVRSGALEFVASSEKIIYAIHWEDKLTRYKISADNGSAITSIASADNSYVIFTTASGNIVCFGADNKKKQWQFDTSSNITAPAIIADGAAYISGEDTNIYKISLYSGKLEWKFRAESSMNNSASVGKDTVYQFVKHKGLYGINKATGKQIYLINDGINIMAEKGNLAYIYANQAVLKVADNSNGEIIKSVNFVPAAKFAINSTGGKIYAADNTGKIVCVEIQ